MDINMKIKELTTAKDWIERGLAVLKLADDPHAFEVETCVLSLKSTITDMQVFPEDYAQ